MKTPQFLKSLFLRLIFVALFGIAALLVVTRAAGLRLESESRRVVRTSLLAIASEDREAQVTVNGKLVAGRSPWRLDSLESEVYYIEVFREGYRSWKKTVFLNPGESVSLENVILFLKEPLVSNFEDNKGEWLDKLAALESESKIQIIDDHELWLDDQLITRLSTTVTQPRFYDDKRHISFVSDDWLHIIDIDGSNDNAILKLGSDDSYLFIEKNSTVLFNDSGILKTARIR